MINKIGFRILGGYLLLLGCLYLLAAVAQLISSHQTASQSHIHAHYVLFGIFPIESASGLAIDYVIHAIVSFVAGAGIVRLKTAGLWIATAIFIYGGVDLTFTHLLAHQPSLLYVVFVVPIDLLIAGWLLISAQRKHNALLA